MSDDVTPTLPRKGSAIMGLFWWVGLALALYVLSTGPVAKYYDKRTPPKAVEYFYVPLAGLYDRVPAVKSFLDWYAAVWGVRL